MTVAAIGYIVKDLQSLEYGWLYLLFLIIRYFCGKSFYYVWCLSNFILFIPRSDGITVGNISFSRNSIYLNEEQLHILGSGSYLSLSVSTSIFSIVLLSLFTAFKLQPYLYFTQQYSYTLRVSWRKECAITLLRTWSDLNTTFVVSVDLAMVRI